MSATNLPERAQSAWRPPQLAVALRSALRSGYSKNDLQSDLLAGVVVGIVALPLSMALAIASGVPPQYGLYTAIVAGFVAALLGGSAVQVSGPTAAFVVLLAPVSAQHGLSGLLLASLLAGLLLVALGVARMGTLIQFVPYPVTVGFTAGIAIVIATLQVKDFLGLTMTHAPEHYLERVTALVQALPTLRWSDTLIGAVTLAVVLLWPRVTRKVPAPLVGLTVGALLAAVLAQVLPDAVVVTINDKFTYVQGGVTRHGVPPLPPLPLWPWAADSHGMDLSFATFRSLLGPAAAIAMLGAIESLLSAVVADGMTGKKHESDTELVALGVANVVAPFFGGFAATGALARTATNVRSGGRSPVAAMTHAVFVLAAVLVLAPLLGYLPMASLAALLLVVAWNMSEAKHVLHTLRIAPKSDVFVLLNCLFLTVIFDMVVSVTVGVLLAALLFMRRMIDVSGVKMVESGNPQLRAPLPPGVLLYEIAGPLFFGAAHKAMSSLRVTSGGVHTVILDLRAVPAMDATGLVNLESAITKLRQMNVRVILAGVQAQPSKVLQRAGVIGKGDTVLEAASVESAIEAMNPAARAG